MKYTLLEMTQDILSNLSSDEVNSISDSPEALQVATIIKQKYYDIISRAGLPEHNQFFQLDPSLTSLEPTLMFIPEGIGHVEWIKYYNSNVLDSLTSTSIHDTNTDIVNPWSTFSSSSVTVSVGSHTFTVPSGLIIHANDPATAVSGINQMTGTVTSYVGTTLVLNITAIVGSGTYTSWSISGTSGLISPPGYKYVTMVPVKQFIDMVNGFSIADGNVNTYTFSDTSNNFPADFTFLYKNDRQPCYCCVLSNFYVIFDSYDKTQDTTLQSSKSMCYGKVVPTFLMTDRFIPDLDNEQFPLLLNEAKSLAFYELKQQPHALAVQETKRQWSTVSKNKNINDRPTAFNELANFGRRSGNYYGRRGFDNKTGNYV